MLSTNLPLWPVAYPDCAEGESFQEKRNISPATWQLAEETAIGLLWNWTGQRFGTALTEVRPCRASCPDRASTFWGSSSSPLIPQIGGWVPALIAGEWFNIACGTCIGARCSCAPNQATSLELPGPVHSITEVLIDGAVLPASAYVLRGGVLYRIDGEAWPLCNSDAGDPTDPDSGAWSITYERGYEVPTGGQLAAYTLACEIAKDLCGDNDCQLPARLQSISRQGVSIEVMDGFEDLEKGRTGIWSIDAWIASETAARVSRPQVFSPDIEPGRGAGTFSGLGFGRTR